MLTAQLLLRQGPVDAFDELAGIQYAMDRGRQHRFLTEQGVAFAQAGRYADAREAWVQSLESGDQQSGAALINIGQSYADERNYPEAIDWLTTAIDSGGLDDWNAAVAYYNRGLAFEALGEHSGGDHDFRFAIRLIPNFGWALNALGRSLAERGKWAEALHWLTSSLELVNDPSAALGDVRPTVEANLSWVQTKNS